MPNKETNTKIINALKTLIKEMPQLIEQTKENILLTEPHWDICTNKIDNEYIDTVTYKNIPAHQIITCIGELTTINPTHKEILKKIYHVNKMDQVYLTAEEIINTQNHKFTEIYLILSNKIDPVLLETEELWNEEEACDKTEEENKK